MSKHGKNFLAAKAKVDQEKAYSPQEAVDLVKETSFTKFDATVEVHLRMGLDPRQADQMVRDVVVLPHGLGKTVKILVFAQGEAAQKAKDAGADYIVDSDEMVNKILGGWTDFDVAMSTPDMMGKVGKLGRVLGPRGLMPNPKADESVVKKETKDKEDDMMAAMRTQSTYMMPLMTIFIGYSFSVGILIYWFVNSAVMAGQQILMAQIDRKK